MSNTKGSSVISNPKSGGAQSGLGEKFSADLFSGTGNFSVPIALAAGRNGFQPSLTLSYSSGSGNGVFGMGWGLSVPGVTRKTSKGIPIYQDKSDIFILSGAEDLVPVKIEQQTIVTPNGNIGHELTYYRPRTEGLFARIVRHKKTNGEHYWEVRSKDGLISWYGTEGAATNDPSVIANPEKRDSIFSWNLTKTEDVFGNVILYSYTRDLVLDSKGRSYDQIYLSTIKYSAYLDGVEEKFMHEVHFVYEDRPDPFSNYKQGFEVRTTKRCIKIETYTNAASLIKTKTFHFNYPSVLALNGATMLESVTVEGHNDTESEFMPPLEFGYSEFDPFKRKLEEISGPLPVNSIGEAGFELVDINGNGLPDLLQLNGTARYWTNKGNGKFSPPRELNIAPTVQLGMPGVQFMDANGDGRTDLFVNNGTVAGYFPGAFHKVWDSNGFRPYEKIPSFSFADPEVQLIDLDGDGVTDVLRNGAKFECFYNDPVKGFYKVRTADKTFSDFSFADPRIRFADMSGDGLQDIVLISSGRVQYWPNMGYGRFGQKVNMKNAPVFPEQYDPSQILLGDLDGDGQTDIAFVENNTVTLYVNQSGNSFSAPVKIKNTPRVLNPRAIRIIDIKGTGQAGILWSFGPDAGTPGQMYFLDLTNGNKSYVLQEMKNNLGALTRVVYGSSVAHYLRDEAHPDTRWKTDLPFPVQVVNRVEVYDFLSGGKLVTEYSYHNGYWDGLEREFRGFAHVDSLDTETFERYNIQDLFLDETVNTVSPVNYTPPVLSKNWFYVGPVGDSFSRWKEPDFSDEYWSGDTNMLTRPLSMDNLLASLPRRARRDALRTLRGTMLRSELYALDGSALQSKPYTVSESLMSLRMEFDPALLPQPLWAENSGYNSGGGYIFFPFGIAQRTTNYERGNDPMHNFSFTKDYDAYGQVQGQISIGVPRGASPLSGGNGDYLASYGLSEYIYKDAGTGIYITDRVKRSLSYDATKSALSRSVFQLRDEVFNSVATLPVLGCTLNYYDGDAFVGLDYGLIGSYGILIRSESLVITDEIITEAYGSNVPQCFKPSPDWSTDYPAAFEGLLQNADERLGYKDRRTGYPNHIAGWYAESDRTKFDFQATIPFYGLPLESKNVFDSLSTIEYDAYNFFPVSSKQWLDVSTYLETIAEYDYRVMQPSKVTDINENSSVFDFSPLGLMRAAAIIGKGTEGDYKSGSGGFYDRYAPSVIMEYDFFAFMNSGDPVFVKSISRELHYQQSAISPTITKVQYSDGFGRLLQMRLQSEDVIYGNQRFGSSGLPVDQTAPNADAVGTERESTDPLNVVVSGWKIYNNKGMVVEQYEPFFDSGFDYVLPDTLGVKVKMFYDPLGRLVKTISSDNSEAWVIYGIPANLAAPVDPMNLSNANSYAPTSWVNFAYDVNDLAEVTSVPGNNVPSTDFYTPKSSEVDALGRTIRTTEYFDNTNYANTVDMNYRYDIQGSLLTVKDPYNRIVYEHVYNLAKQGLWTKHIDKGESIVIPDVQSKPIESHDAKGAMSLSAYDVLGRPNNAWARNKTGDATTLRGHLIYGDGAGLTNPQNENLKGQLYQSYDEAGFIEIPEYDFKGNVLSKKRQVISSVTLKAALDVYTTFIVDWTGLPNILDSFVFETSMDYDALNRVTEITLPQDVNTNRKTIVPEYNRAGALEKVNYDGTVYIENIAYNAKGQRLFIALGNNVMTRYAYDPITFRLLRQRSEKYTKSIVGQMYTYAYESGTVRQDDGFNFDLIGNIMKILTRVADCGINGSILGDNALDRTFAYDSLYRLTDADGRESDTQNGNDYLYTDAPAPGTPNANNVRKYNRAYTYDKVGNIKSMVQTDTNGFTRDFIYNSGVNSLNKIQDGSAILIEDYTYDANANQLTAGSTRNYVWNHADQLICYYNQAGAGNPTVYAQYDYSVQDRVSKLVRTGTDVSPIYERTIYIDGIFEYCILEDTSTYEKNYVHIMDGGSRIAEVRIGTAFPNDIGDNIVYILSDQIGSSSVRLDSSGTLIDIEEYYPFGDSSLRTFSSKRYRYVGKEKDQESGLYYYGARYYAAWTCRFISVDPLASKYAQLTPYNYADNNPINDFDIDGMQTLKTETSQGNNSQNTNTPRQLNFADMPKSNSQSAQQKINASVSTVTTYGAGTTVNSSTPPSLPKSTTPPVVKSTIPPISTVTTYGAGSTVVPATPPVSVTTSTSTPPLTTVTTYGPGSTPEHLLPHAAFHVQSVSVGGGFVLGGEATFKEFMITPNKHTKDFLYPAEQFGIWEVDLKAGTVGYGGSLKFGSGYLLHPDPWKPYSEQIMAITDFDIEGTYGFVTASTTNEVSLDSNRLHYWMAGGALGAKVKFESPIPIEIGSGFNGLVYTTLKPKTNADSAKTAKAFPNHEVSKAFNAKEAQKMTKTKFLD
jgi:RHS repeat-associated protein